MPVAAAPCGSFATTEAVGWRTARGHATGRHSDSSSVLGGTVRSGGRAGRVRSPRPRASDAPIGTSRPVSTGSKRRWPLDGHTGSQARTSPANRRPVRVIEGASREVPVVAHLSQRAGEMVVRVAVIEAHAVVLA